MATKPFFKTEITCSIDAFKRDIRSCMSRDLETLPSRSSIEQVISVLKKGFVVIVADDQRFYGLITQIDLLNYLRRQMKAA